MIRRSAPLLVGALIVAAACSGAEGGSVDTSTAVALKSNDAEQIAETIGAALPAAVLSDGGTAGPFPCSGDKSGLEFYTVRWTVDPGDATFDELLSELGPRLEGQGFRVDRSQLEGVRPTVTYFDGRREVSVTRYEETGLVQLSLDTECGAPSE